MTTTVITLADDFETSEWAEYRIVCQHNKNHYLDRPTNRDRTLKQLEQYDVLDCGPHELQQRLLARIDGPWGQLLSSDPQTDSTRRIHTWAATMACPRCEAPAGEDCWNIAVLKGSGKRVNVKWPHTERFDAVEASKGQR